MLKYRLQQDLECAKSFGCRLCDLYILWRHWSQQLLSAYNVLRWIYFSALDHISKSWRVVFKIANHILDILVFNEQVQKFYVLS